MQHPAILKFDTLLKDCGGVVSAEGVGGSLQERP